MSPGCPVVPVPSPPAAPGKAGGSRVCFSMLTLALCDVAFGNPAPPAFLSQTWPVVRTPCVPRSHRLPVTGLPFSCPFKRKGLFPSCTPCSISHRYSSSSSIAVLVSRAVEWRAGMEPSVCPCCCLSPGAAQHGSPFPPWWGRLAHLPRCLRGPRVSPAAGGSGAGLERSGGTQVSPSDSRLKQLVQHGPYLPIRCKNKGF